MICGLAQLNTCSGKASPHMHGRVQCQAYNYSGLSQSNLCTHLKRSNRCKCSMYLKEVEFASRENVHSRTPQPESENRTLTPLFLQHLPCLSQTAVICIMPHTPLYSTNMYQSKYHSECTSSGEANIAQGEAKYKPVKVSLMLVHYGKILHKGATSLEGNIYYVCGTLFQGLYFPGKNIAHYVQCGMLKHSSAL